MVAAIVFSTIPNSSISWSKNVWWTSLKFLKEARVITAFTCFSKRTGSTTTLAGLASASPTLICQLCSGKSRTTSFLRSRAHCPMSVSPSLKRGWSSLVPP